MERNCYLDRHNADLAGKVVQANAIKPLVDCLNEKEISLKRGASSTLTEIAKHSRTLAGKVKDEKAIAGLIHLLDDKDSVLTRQVCTCLASIASHAMELADSVAVSGVLDRIPDCLVDADIKVRMSAANVLKELTKKSERHANQVMSAVRSAPIVEFVSNCSGEARLPGIETLGNIAKESEGNLAKECIRDNAHIALKNALTNETQDKIKARAAWALGKLGRHSADNANVLAKEGILKDLRDAYSMPGASDDLKKRAKKALIQIIQKCNDIQLIEPLIDNSTDHDILTSVVEQCSTLLRDSLEKKKYFLEHGGFKKLQEIKTGGGEKLKEHRDKINSYYPTDVVLYFAPDAEEKIIKKIEEAQD